MTSLAKTYPTPAWLKRGCIQWAGGLHQQANLARRDGSPVIFYERAARWFDQWYSRVHTEAAVERLVEAGVNCITVHFWTGAGLAADKPDTDLCRKLVGFCHKHGVRALGYMQFRSVMSETFFHEHPEARDWLQTSSDGRPVLYAGRYYRPAPCLNRDEYIACLKEAITVGLREVGLDGIRLDNDYFRGCYCSACQRKFKEYLKSRYDTPAKVDARFGLPYLDDVAIPTEGSFYDSVYQEWVRFRCESLARVHRELYLHVKAISPDAVFGGNPAYPRGANWIIDRGLDLVELGHWMDVLEVENPYAPQPLDNGAVVSQIQGYKTGNAIGCMVKPAQWLWKEGRHAPPTEGHEVALALSEAAAFGGHVAGAIWALRPWQNGEKSYYEKPELHETWRRYNRFFAAHRHLYADAEPAATVALLYGEEALAWDFDRVYPCILGFQQVLLQKRIPFEIVFASRIDRIHQYNTAILANQTCLSDETCEAVRRFVARGNGLVVTGESSLFDENLSHRGKPALADILDQSARVVRFPDTPERIPFKAGTEPQPLLPERADELAGAVRAAAWRGLPVEVDASDHVAVDVYRLPSGEMTVHLLNYRNTAPVADISVRVNTRFFRPTAATLHNPELAGPLSLQMREATQAMELNVPVLNTYAVIVLTPEKEGAKA